MLCSYPECYISNNPKLLDCVWCGQKYHKRCLLQLGVFISDNSNIECSFCFPKLPLNITCQTSKPFDKLKILKLGDAIYPELELEKTPTDRHYIYPIGYLCVRTLPSYKNKFLTTTVRLEIFCVDEKYPDGGGEKDTYLFQITYKDDEYNPIKVLHSPRYISSTIKKRYKCATNIPCGISLYGLDNKYIQYLICTHIPQANDISITTTDKLLLEINDDMDGICETKKVYRVNPRFHENIYFDPQQELFNF